MACGVREGLWRSEALAPGADKGEHSGGRLLWGGPEELEAGSLRSREGSRCGSLEEAAPGGLEKAAEGLGKEPGFCPKGGEAFEGRAVTQLRSTSVGHPCGEVTVGATVEAESHEEADAATDRIGAPVVTGGWMGELTHRPATDWTRVSEDEPSHFNSRRLDLKAQLSH